MSSGARQLLLLHGWDDRFILCVQRERIRDAPADVELRTYPGADHMWLGAPDAASGTLDRTAASQRRHVTPRGEQS